MISRTEILRRLFELAVIWALFYFAYRRLNVRQELRLLAANSTWVPALLIGYFVASSFVQCFTFRQYDYPDAVEAFPFTRWAMFSGSSVSSDLTIIYEFQGVTTDGEVVYLNPARLFLTPNAVVLFTKAHCLGDALTHSSSEKKSRAAELLNHYMIGIKNRYEADHPNVRLQRIVLWRRKIQLDGVHVPEPFTEPDSLAVYTANFSE